MRTVYPAAVLACLALSGCANLRDPDVKLPTVYEAPQPGGLSVLALDRWWTNFEDPQLTGLIEQALSASPDALAAAARLKEARALAGSAMTRFLPQGDLAGSTRETHTDQLSGAVVNIPGFSNSGTSNSAAVNFNVSWELDLFGRIFAVGRAARGDKAAARFAYEGARASLAANVADAYFQARGLAIQLEDARETVRIQSGLQEIAAKKISRGLAAASDGDRVAADLAQARSQATSLEAELQAARRVLLVLIGRGAQPIESLPIVAAVGAAPAVPTTVPSDLLARRPDVREAQARVASAAGRSDLAMLAFFPTFTLLPGRGWSRSEQPNFGSTSQNWSIGVSGTQPILSIPRLLMDLKAQGARAEQAVIAYEKSVQTAFGEAENALLRLDSDRRRTDLLLEGESRGRRAFDAARRRYAMGLDDLQSTLLAEQAWRATRTQLTSEQVQTLRRAVQAYKALGGGWPAQTVSDRPRPG